ncbi:MAG: hypothetical protein ACFE9D_00025 [Promethearchaeota archaeon]
MTQNLSEIGETYIYLGFKIDHFLKQEIGPDTIIVDSYFGPSELKPEKSVVDPDGLLSLIKRFQVNVKKQIRDEPRRSYLLRQSDALKLLVQYGLEEPVTFQERVKIGLNVDVVTISSERIDELTEQASRALRNEVLTGDLTSMATRWRNRAMTKGAEIIPLAEEVALEARKATQKLLFTLPEQEGVEFRAIDEAPWSAYNHYQGNYRAIIEINIALPRSKYTIWKWVTHETYPGHQTQLVQQESGYHSGTHNLESTIAIINTPECTIAEGLAEAGTDILSSVRPLTKPETVSNYLMQLRRAVGINALVMIQQEQRSELEVVDYLKDMGAYETAYAEARIPFMTDSIWGPYGYTYLVGAWLVQGFYSAAQEANLLDEFIKALYFESHTPSTLKTRISNLDLKLPKNLI